MILRIKKRAKDIRKTISYLFLITCFFPFLFPNPIVTTNIQPYAALLGTVVVLLKNDELNLNLFKNLAIITGFTFFVSLIVMLFSGLSVDSFRAIYNYYALFIIPLAVIHAYQILGGIPEKFFKLLIGVWFIVGTIQFFIYRGFCTNLISGVRWSYSYRGVVGLASEPSFFGIACFYFLHIANRFEGKKYLFMVLSLFMGVIYAQSMMGIMFLAGYILVYLFEIVNTKKGLAIWGVCFFGLAGFVYYLNNYMTGTRLFQIYQSLIEGGVDSVLSDGSASVRFNAIGNSINTALNNFLLPNGFSARIGSGYGGLLVELGLFSIPAILVISYIMTKTFQKKRSRFLYFFVVTFLLFNNTQIGNPLLLIVLGTNVFLGSNLTKSISYEART